MIYEVSGGGESVRVDGDNWLVALGASLEFFGLDPSGLARLAIDMRPGGEVQVKDPLTGRAFRLAPVPDAAPSAPVRLKLGAMQTALAGLPADEDTIEEVAPEPLIMPTSIFAPPPELAPLEGDSEDDLSPASPVEDTGRASHVRAPTHVEGDRPVDLHEELFFRSMDITAAGTIDEGCRAALAILRELIPSEAGAVLYASINDTRLRFVSAFGPAARQVLAREVPVDAGVAGFCHLRGVGMVIDDTSQDQRHDPAVDRATGYHTRRLLSAGIRDEANHSFGCIQLLNAPQSFRDWHLEAAQVIASELADFIAHRQ